MIGERIGEYEIREIIGRGGMAAVYKAYQPSMDRYVALKLLPVQLTEDPKALRRFQDEAKLIARLEHRSIIPIYGYGEHEGQPYLVMRLLEAGSVRRRLLQGRFPLPMAARIIQQVGEALDYAHAQGVIHRDLKPSNILLDERNNAYLTDFGIAKMLGADTNITADGVVGTPHYMSPEQCQGKRATPASDLYALGAILFELVTGHLPFEADTPLAVMYMQVKAPVPSVTAIDPSLPASIDAIIVRAMAKKPERRYSSGGALAADLRRVLIAGAGVRPAGEGASGSNVRPSLPRPHRRRMVLMWLVITAALLGAAVITLSSLGGRARSGTASQTPTQQSTDRQTITPLPSSTPLPEPSSTPFGILIEPSPSGATPSTSTPEEPSEQPSAVTPDTALPITQQATAATSEATPNLALTPVPGKLAYTAGSNETAEIVVSNDDGSSPITLTQNTLYDGEPDWSPDGTQLAYESSRAGNIDIYIMQADGSGQPEQITTSAQPDRHPDWSPDGTLIAYESGTGEDTEIYVVTVASKEITRITDNTFGDRAPKFSPDGTQIAYMTDQRGQWEIAIMSYPAGSIVKFLDCPDVDCRFPDWSPDGKDIVYNTLNSDSQVGAIWVVDVASGLSTQLVDTGENGRPVWSGDGAFIYFNRDEGDGANLFRYDLSTGETTRLTNTPGDEYAPDWAPRSP